MSGMPGMGAMGQLPPLTWARFFRTWHLQPGWLELAALLIGGYLIARFKSGRPSSMAGWRVGSYVAGVVLLWACVSSAVGTYAMSLFWMHMVLHLTLIMVVPALLVLGHPLTVLLESVPPEAQAQVRRALRSWPVTMLAHPASGVLLYTVVIIGTHLTGFMDQMAQHAWLMTGEQALYVVAGYLFLQPLLGEEPTRPDPPYLLRLAILVAAMIPDTIVGIVLLQTSTVPFPVMAGMRPSWTPSAISDVHAAGGLMWAGGDGLMMAIAVGLMISVITSPTRRSRMIGPLLEGVRRSTLSEHTGEQQGDDVDPDSDEALAAYNRMLTRLHSQERRGR